MIRNDAEMEDWAYAIAYSAIGFGLAFLVVSTLVRLLFLFTL